MVSGGTAGSTRADQRRHHADRVRVKHVRRATHRHVRCKHAQGIRQKHRGTRGAYEFLVVPLECCASGCRAVDQTTHPLVLPVVPPGASWHPAQAQHHLAHRLLGRWEDGADDAVPLAHIDTDLRACAGQGGREAGRPNVAPW